MTQTLWQPLVSYHRSGIPEVVKFGAVSWVSGSQLVFETGGNPLCFGRSLMKPWQMKGVTKVLDNHLSSEQKALSLASHNAERQHIHCAQSILPDSQHTLLNTPACMPLMPNTEETEPYNKEPDKKEPNKWNHPCSGKHAAIIRACVLNNWPVENYQSDSHPYHQVFIQSIRDVIGDDWQPEEIAIDGCGLPTFSQSVREMAQLFASLAANKQEDWIWQSMVQHPDLIGGKNRLDSAIIKAGKGKIVAKEGADGLLGMAIEHPEYPDGLGIVIKLSHGWDGTATWFVATEILASLGIVLEPPAAPDGQTAHVAAHVCP